MSRIVDGRENTPFTGCAANDVKIWGQTGGVHLECTPDVRQETRDNSRAPLLPRSSDFVTLTLNSVLTCPLRLIHHDGSGLAIGVVAITAPCPLLGLLYQSPLQRIAAHIR